MAGIEVERALSLEIAKTQFKDYSARVLYVIAILVSLLAMSVADARSKVIFTYLGVTLMIIGVFMTLPPILALTDTEELPSDSADMTD